MSFEGLFNVLSSKPVLNKVIYSKFLKSNDLLIYLILKLTVYSALMELKTGRLETYIQFCPTPCDPF